jgi:hypothetical protein
VTIKAYLRMADRRTSGRYRVLAVTLTFYSSNYA